MPRELSAIEEKTPISREARLDIYAEGYFLRLCESIASDYESLRAVLNEEQFRGLVADFLVAHPSRFPSIGDVGAPLPKFLREHPLARELPFLPDLAALEWALVEGFYAPEYPRLDPTQLAGIAPEAWGRAKLTLDSSVRLLRSEWPIDEIWSAKTSPSGPCATLVLAYRISGQLQDAEDFDRLQVERLEPMQYDFLECIREGLSLGKIFERVQQMLAEDAEMPPLFEWFGGWVASGVIRDISFSDDALSATE